MCFYTYILGHGFPCTIRVASRAHGPSRRSYISSLRRSPNPTTLMVKPLKIGLLKKYYIGAGGGSSSMQVLTLGVHLSLHYNEIWAHVPLAYNVQCIDVVVERLIAHLCMTTRLFSCLIDSMYGAFPCKRSGFYAISEKKSFPITFIR